MNVSIKRYVALFLLLALCFFFSACGGNEETAAPDDVRSSDISFEEWILGYVKGGETAVSNDTETSDVLSEERIANTEELIDEIGTISTEGNVSLQGEILFSDDGIIAYEAALKSFNALSTEEKLQVKNDYILEESQADYEAAKAEKARCKAKSDIIFECKNAVVTGLKSRLKDPYSYEERDFAVGFSSIADDFGQDSDFVASVDITYSATNSYGGRLEDTVWASVYGQYSDGNITITKIIRW